MLQGEHSAILSTFIGLAFVIKIFILSIFEWPFYTGVTVYDPCFERPMSYVNSEDADQRVMKTIAHCIVAFLARFYNVQC